MSDADLMRSTGTDAARASRNKVPQITIFFWIIKVLATTVGETFADFLATNLGLGLVTTSIVMAALFAVSLVVQFRAPRYVPAIYWTVVVLISVVGTLASDTLVDKLGVGLPISTVAFAAILAVVFVLWYRSEGTLSVHEVASRRREIFYWSAILFTFALGTSAGDLLSEKSGFGYLAAAAMFAAIIAADVVAYFGFRINGILAFWIAYIMTRPLGASLGDLLSQARADGGLGLGTTVTSVVFLATIVVLVAILTRRLRHDEHAVVPAR